MKITRILWDQDRIDHIARHGIEPYEVEEAAYDDPDSFIKKVKVSYRNSAQFVYRLLGRTYGGKYLAFFFIHKGRGVVYPITAREMNGAERRLYHGYRR